MEKRILVHDYAGHPFQLDLSKKLAEIGYEVFHLYSKSSGGPKAGFSFKKENLTIIDINIGIIKKQSFYKRFFQEYNYGKLLVQKAKEINPDIIISSNTPIFAQHLISKYALKTKKKFIFWLQDIISIAAKEIISKENKLIGTIIGFVFKFFEKKNLKRSTSIVCICEEFQVILEEWKIYDQVLVIPNWAPIQLFPVLNKKNNWSKQYKIENKFVVLYSGTMGMKHNPEIIIDTAQNLVNHKDIIFIVISEGEGANFIKKKLTNKKLNIQVIPFQDFNILPQVLASADILLTILEKEAGAFSVPSKVWSYYCASRTVFLDVPKDNLASKITNNINAGIIIDGHKDFSDKILYYRNNPHKLYEMGKNARNYAEKNFNINSITEKFINLF